MAQCKSKTYILSRVLSFDSWNLVFLFLNLGFIVSTKSKVGNKFLVYLRLFIS